MTSSTQPPSTELMHLTRIALRMLLAQYDLARPTDPPLAHMDADLSAMRALAHEPQWSLDSLVMGVRWVIRYEALLWPENPEISHCVQNFSVRCAREQYQHDTHSIPFSPTPSDVDAVLHRAASSNPDNAQPSAAPYGFRRDGTPRQRPAGPGRPSLPPDARARNKQISQAGWRSRNSIQVRDYMRAYRLTRRQMKLIDDATQAQNDLAQLVRHRNWFLRIQRLNLLDDHAAQAAYEQALAQARSRATLTRKQLALLDQFEAPSVDSGNDTDCSANDDDPSTI
jgi:hypothetical protein